MSDSNPNFPTLECCDPNPFVYQPPCNQSVQKPQLQLGDICSSCLGAAFSQTITATGFGPILTWTIIAGGVPSGLTFHGGTNSNGYVLIDGTPTGTGSTLTVQAVDQYGYTVTGTFSIYVVAITTSSLPDFTVGTPYDFTLTASGGIGPYAWDIVSGHLPSGLTLNSTTGEISGTPDGMDLGSGTIYFGVIDTACEAGPQPSENQRVILSTASVSTFATLYGYSEFGTPSLPPKKYRTITLNGTSIRTGFTAEQTPRQCAGAQYVFGGVGQVDFHGNQISNYTKDFYAQCPKQFWPPVPLLTNSFSQSPCAQIPFCSFVGYCWTPDPNSCSVCDPTIVNWPFISHQATGDPVADLNAFRAAGVIVTNTSYSVTGQFFAFTEIAVDQSFTSTLSGVHYPISVGAQTFDGESVFTNPPNVTFPPVSIGGVVAQYINFVDSNNFSGVLTDEYTDADALANATVINGKDDTAINQPRTTGFTSVFVSVTYALTCINLLPGQDYIVYVDLADLTAFTITTVATPFTADNTGMHVITATIPTPAVGHRVQVRYARIVLAQ